MLEIINPIKFPSWDVFQRRNVNGYIGETIFYSIYDYDGERLDCQCRWGNQSSMEKASFPYSEDGYRQAQEWVEHQRLALIQSLL